ncbi:MAG TPA: zinc-ribbon domain-containing protein [Polyangiaceae bacterium]|nr:zinc-ribbon domain-containing protein [Polyangiaceae bacterium]
MKIACESCGAKYTIADDKVRGRRVKIRCKGCGTPIVVDGQPSGAPSISDAETDAALEAEAPVTWSVNLSETDSRTMSTEEIVAAYASGVITADAFVWKDGMGDWVPLLESELAPLLAAPAQAAAGGARGAVYAAAQPQAARPAATAKAQPNTHDLFGSLETAGSEEAASSAPSVPQAGSSAYDDGKMTGARNENSVLFSLDALKAGFSPSAPSTSKSSPKAPGKSGPGAVRPQQPSNPDDPFGMSAASGLMGGGGALFGADNHALMNAPAPPPPPVAPPPSAFAAGAMPAAYAPPKNNKLVYIVGGVSGVVIIGLLVALLSGKKSDTSAANSTAASASATTAAVAEKPAEEPKKEEPKKEEPTATAPSASASASAAPSVSAAAPGKAVASTGGGAVATTKKKEEAPPPADAPPFSKASAISALTAAAGSAGACKKPGGPTGPGKATVTFAPSGRVTTATVAGGSYAGTAVGGCVASAFRRAHVPAFSGSAVTVSKSFQIN